MSIPNRRQFLIQASALAAAATTPRTLFSELVSTKVAPSIPNSDTLLKFHPDGTPRPFAGNTVICHLPVQCAMRDAMLKLHHELADAPYRHKLALTSTDSYHMTVFPGANDKRRNVYGWPSYVPADASIEECTRMVGERIGNTSFSCELPLRMRLDVVATTNHPTACSLQMIAADEKEEKQLRSLRDQLSGVFGFKLPDHAAYHFHMTMSYQLAPFTPQEEGDYRQLIRTHVQHMSSIVPVLELGIPEFCAFQDMFRFDPQKLLACS